MLACDAETKTTVVDTALVSALIREKGRSDALAGGLRCEQGHVMKFVDEHASRGSTVRAYFAHVTKGDITASGAHEATHTGPRAHSRCSDVHLLAQRLIQQNVNRIVATRFKSCGECVELAFRPSGSVRAEIEVTERTLRGTIRSDVVVYEGDERLIAFEVKHTHGTEPTSREGLPYLEVDAAHVVSQIEACASDARIVLKCESGTTPCTRWCKARRRRAEAVRKREWRRRKGITCASCNETGRDHGTFDDGCSDCGQWWGNFLSESEFLRMKSDEASSPLRRAKAIRKREWRREKGITCGSCNETGEGHGTFDGECPDCGQWWADFLSESELLRMRSDKTSLVYVPFPFGGLGSDSDGDDAGYYSQD
jgi:hypothetical protein